MGIPAGCCSFHLATLVSDLLGLSSFNVRYYPHIIYRLTVLSVVILAQIQLRNATIFESRTKTVFFSIRVWCLFTSYIIIFILQLLRENRIRKCHSKCSSLSSFSPFRCIILHYIYFVVKFLINHFFYNFTLSQNILYNLFVLYSVLFPSIQYEYLMGSIRKQLEMINRRLEDIVNKDHRNLYVMKKAKEKSDIIFKVHKEFFTMRDIASYVTKTYSYQILVIIAEFTIEIFFVLQFFFFDYVREKKNPQPNVDFIFKVFTVFSLLYRLFTIARSGENHSEQCRQTEINICRLANTLSWENSETRAFILQGLLDPVSVSILGLFQLDYKFLYKIGCGIFNYGLIIAMFYLGMIKKYGGLS